MGKIFVHEKEADRKIEIGDCWDTEKKEGELGSNARISEELKEIKILLQLIVIKLRGPIPDGVKSPANE